MIIPDLSARNCQGRNQAPENQEMSGSIHNLHRAGVMFRPNTGDQGTKPLSRRKTRSDWIQKQGIAHAGYICLGQATLRSNQVSHYSVILVFIKNENYHRRS
jgi:hypothetical protein